MVNTWSAPQEVPLGCTAKHLQAEVFCNISTQAEYLPRFVFVPRLRLGMHAKGSAFFLDQSMVHGMHPTGLNSSPEGR